MSLCRCLLPMLFSVLWAAGLHGQERTPIRPEITASETSPVKGLVRVVGGELRFPFVPVDSKLQVYVAWQGIIFSGLMPQEEVVVETEELVIGVDPGSQPIWIARVLGNDQEPLASTLVGFKMGYERMGVELAAPTDEFGRLRADGRFELLASSIGWDQEDLTSIQVVVQSSTVLSKGQVVPQKLEFEPDCREMDVVVRLDASLALGLPKSWRDAQNLHVELHGSEGNLRSRVFQDGVARFSLLTDELHSANVTVLGVRCSGERGYQTFGGIAPVGRGSPGWNGGDVEPHDLALEDAGPLYPITVALADGSRALEVRLASVFSTEVVLTAPDGVYSFACPEGCEFGAVIRARGYLPQRVGGQPSARSITLQRAHVVQLDLHRIAIGDDQISVEVATVRLDEGSDERPPFDPKLLPTFLKAYTGEQDRTLVDLPGPGRYCAWVNLVDGATGEHREIHCGVFDAPAMGGTVVLLPYATHK